MCAVGIAPSFCHGVPGKPVGFFAAGAQSPCRDIPGTARIARHDNPGENAAYSRTGKRQAPESHFFVMIECPTPFISSSPIVKITTRSLFD
jgi:hypothetical protein